MQTILTELLEPGGDALRIELDPDMGIGGQGPAQQWRAL